MRIGDKVIMNKKTVKLYIGHLPGWYTNDIYTVCNISPSGDSITLDKVLTGYTNQIHKSYLISMTELRKQKLDKLNSL